MQPVDLVGPTAINALESLGAAEAANANTDASLIPRAWWKANAEKTKADGLAESLEYVKQVLIGRRFDVSQSSVRLEVLFIDGIFSGRAYWGLGELRMPFNFGW
jgi:hypothetical protein